MYPKQLLPIAGEKTMLQATALRTSALSTVGLQRAENKHLIVSNESHRFLVAEQMNGIERRAQIILEPEGRNTAPAVALAALLAIEAHPDVVLLIMPADHVIKDVAAFQAAVNRGLAAAEDGKLVTFGIVPDAPETGYGYIKAAPDGDAAVPVMEFVAACFYSRPLLTSTNSKPWCLTCTRRARTAWLESRSTATLSAPMRNCLLPVRRTRSITRSWKNRAMR
jgi:mannose-1-phosphate guanylyltransferase